MTSNGAIAFPYLVHSNELAEKIEDLKMLGPGWRFGEGKSFDIHTISTAQLLAVYGRVRSIWHADAFPGVDGEIVVAFYLGNRNLELTVRQDLTVEITEEDNGNEIAYEEAATVQGALAAIERFTARKWTTPELFIFESGTLSLSDLEVQRSKRDLCPLLIRAVRNPKAQPYATTFGRITERSRVLPLYIGASPYQDSDLETANSL